MSIDKQVQAGRLLIVPPRRVTPRLVWPNWRAPIGSRRQPPDQPNVWPGMQVLVVGSASTRFIAKAAEWTAPDGKVIVISPGDKTMSRLEKRLAPLGFGHLVLETSSPGQSPLSDQSIDRAFLVMGLRQVPSLDRTLEEVHRVVKPEGRLIVHRRLLFAGLLPRQRIVSMCADVGLDLVVSHATLFHYTLTFEERDCEHPDPA